MMSEWDNNVHFVLNWFWYANQLKQNAIFFIWRKSLQSLQDEPV